MKWVEQPRPSRVCGQVAIAVLCGLTLDQACRQIGHRKGTRTKALVRVLRAFGFQCEDHCKRRVRSEMPDVALAQVRTIGRPQDSWHWIVVANGVVYDGCEGGIHTLEWYERAILRNGYKITSYLALTHPHVNLNLTPSTRRTTVSA